MPLVKEGIAEQVGACSPDHYLKALVTYLRQRSNAKNKRLSFGDCEIVLNCL